MLRITYLLSNIKLDKQQLLVTKNSIDDLKQADIKLLDVLNKLYVDALGGESEDGDEKKEA